jgi:hypothetical protein
MAIDPLSAGVNLTGLIMGDAAARRAADAANNNRIQQLAGGAANLEQQYGNTNEMLGINTALQELLRQSGGDTNKLIEQIVGQQNQIVDTSARKRMDDVTGNSIARQQLVQLLAKRDTDQASSSVSAMNRAATADRRDVHDNITYYDPKTGGFNTSLSAPQTDIERGFTSAEDARLKGLNEAIARSRFDRSPSEDSIRSELTGLMSGTNAAKMKEIQDTIGRQALRMGRGGDIPTLIKSINDQVGSQLPQTMLDARNQAVQEYIARENARTNRSNVDIESLRNPLAAPVSLTNADTERRAATDNLGKTLSTGANLAQTATTTAGNRISGAQDKSFEDIVSTLADTEKQRLGTYTSGNALRLNNQSNDIQRMIDALTQRQNIFSGNATRVHNAITGAMGNVNTASAQNVTAIGKEAPNATILGNLAKNFSLNDSSKSKSSSGSDEGNQQMIDDIVSKLMEGA